MQTPGRRLKCCHLPRQGQRCPGKYRFLQTAVFVQKITQHHVLQNGQSIKAQQAQQLAQYSQDQIVEPTQQYLNETVAEHLQGLTPNFTAVRHNLQACMRVRSLVYLPYTLVKSLLLHSTLRQWVLHARQAPLRSSDVLLLAVWNGMQAHTVQLTSFACA